MARQFGIVSAATGAITGCVINSLKRGTSAQSAEARDEKGLMTDKWYYSKEKTISISGVLDAASLGTEAGQSLTLGDDTFGVNSTSQDETNTAAVTFTIDASIADAATVHAYVPPTA